MDAPWFDVWTLAPDGTGMRPSRRSPDPRAAGHAAAHFRAPVEGPELLGRLRDGEVVVGRDTRADVRSAVAVALVDDDDARGHDCLAVGFTPGTEPSEAVVDLLGDAAVHLRHHLRRERVERRMRDRARAEELLIGLAWQALHVGPARLDDFERRVCRELSGFLGVPVTLESTCGSGEDPDRVTVRVPHPTVALGPVPDAPDRLTAAVPAGSGDPAAAAVLGRGALLLGHTRERLAAQRIAEVRHQAQSLLTRTASALVTADTASAAGLFADVVAGVGDLLGADAAYLDRVDHRRRVFVVDHEWTATGEPILPPGTTVAFDRVPSLDRMLAGETVVLVREAARTSTSRYRQVPAGRWTQIGAPVTVGATVRAVLSVTWLHEIAEPAMAAELCRALADLAAQLETRLSMQADLDRRRQIDRAVSEAAEILLAAGAESANRAVHRALGIVGEALDLDTLSVWRRDTRGGLRRIHGWSSRPVEIDDRLAPGDVDTIDEAFATARTVRVGGADGGPCALLVVPRVREGRVTSVLVASSPGPRDHDDTVESGLAAISRVVEHFDVRVAAERYATATFDSTPVGVVLVDRRRRILACNPAFSRLVGTPREALVGTALFDLVADADTTVRSPRRIEGEVVLRRRDGRRIVARVTGRRIDPADGSERFWLVHAEDVTEQRRSYELLTHQATHDELTGLANRRLLRRRIRDALVSAGGAGLVLLDLDRFKWINDSQGHAAGDRFLVTVADRLRLAVRPEDLIARLGGDEFAVLVEGATDVGDLLPLAHRLREVLARPVVTGGVELESSASIGVAVAAAGSGELGPSDPEHDLLRPADVAMYRAKAAGGNRVVAYDEELKREVDERIELETGLRMARRRAELEVHYQPEVDLVDGRVLGAEALVRWRHRTRGLLAAGSFIGIAEEAGLVADIGEFVLRRACADAVDRLGPGPGGEQLRIRVNLAASQVQSDDTVDLVRGALEESGLPAAHLSLEITESAMMVDVDRSIEVLGALRDLGVELAVDDFGTGFSSLAYLKHFPVQVLKIDRSFVRGLGRAGSAEDLAFVRSIVSLARALGLDVIAEGVETPAQAAVLRELGCRRAQGYLFGRPMPVDELGGRLASGRDRTVGTTVQPGPDELA